MNRGEYRTVFVAFGDDPDVHELSGNAVKLLLFLKLALPPTGIGVVYPSMFAEKMRCAAAELEQLLQELERPKRDSDRGWIARERNVVWIFNALKHEPNLIATNAKKHAPFVRRLVAELDHKLHIVAAFKSSYKEWFPDAPDTLWEGYRNPIDRVSGDTVSDRVSKGYRNNSSNLTKQDQSSGDLSKEREPLPPAAVDFGRKFYGSASPDRIRDVKRQLRATLNGGASFRKGVRVLACSPERLEAKCREVIAAGVKDPDKAIVVLLKKLGDVSDDSPTERAQADAKLDDARATGDGAHRLQLALAWLDTQPALATEITQLVDAGLPPGSMPAIVAIYRNAAISKAWRDAGEPSVQPAGGS